MDSINIRHVNKFQLKPVADQSERQPAFKRQICTDIEDFLLRSERPSASDGKLELWQWYDHGESYGFAESYIDVRLLGDYVVWFTEDYDGKLPWCHFRNDELVLIEKTIYERELGVGRTFALPPLNFGQLARRLSNDLLNVKCYNDLHEHTVYREPRSASDPRGNKVLWSFYRWLIPRYDMSTTEVEEKKREHLYRLPTETRQPQISTAITVYVDVSGGMEFKCKVGQLKKGWALKLDQYPTCPVWLSGPAIDYMIECSEGLL